MATQSIRLSAHPETFVYEAATINVLQVTPGWSGMHFDNDELRKTISQLTDEQLVRMMGVESGDYRKEALEFAEAEIKNRGISVSELAGTALAPTQNEQNHPSTGPNVTILNSPSPFDRFRARSLPIWLFLSIVIFAPLTLWMTQGTPLAEKGKILFSAEIHFLIVAWICWQSLRCNINSEQLLVLHPISSRFGHSWL